jgi:DNA-directed RNA polymerase subunit RPC12/RpoP
MSLKTAIPCPACGEKIFIEAKQLALGMNFSCSNVACGSSISLNVESQDDTLKAVEKFEQLKSENAILN